MKWYKKLLLICIIPALFLTMGAVVQTWKHSGAPTKIIFCLEADSKPTTDASGDAIPAGSELIETDTGDRYFYNGTSWLQMQPSSTDNNTYAIMTVGYEHHRIHDGNSYTVQYQGEVTNLNEKTVVAFKTSNTTKWMHMVALATSNDSTSFMIAEVTSIDPCEGTDAVAYNRNRNSTNTSGVLSLWGDPNIGYVTTFDETAAANANITTTTTIYHEDIGETGNPQTASGGGTRGLHEFILKQNTEYAFILNAENANTQIHNIILNWYEHTSKE